MTWRSPEGQADAIRDAFGLVQAAATRDEAGTDVILANCDLERVAQLLAETLVITLGSLGRDPLAALARMRKALLT